MNLFYDDFKIDKPLRLIELFAGYGSQAMAFDRIGVKYEHHYVCEYDKYAMKSYNAVHGTDFKPTDIRNVHAADLNIVDTDKYCYFMTYSFPCTDISNAGKMLAVKDGLKKGSSTRSGLLWEVERLLEECTELPQILFMENVPGTVTLEGFKDWFRYLEKKGYSNYWKILNAKDYGVPQNRERAFMFSFLGDYDYEFPEGFELETRVKDILEDEVDEKYYINNERAEKLILNLKMRNELPLEDMNTCLIKKQFNELDKYTDVATTLMARDYKGPGNQSFNGVIEKKIPVTMNYSKIDKVNTDVAKTLCARDYKGFGTGYDTMNAVVEKSKG